jgi:hypothetical protein
MIMTKALLASVAILFALSVSSFASAPSKDTGAGFNVKSDVIQMEAKRRKPRVPGGSGCDDPRDVAEHPECTPSAAIMIDNQSVIPVMEAKRRKPRVPGGSGCDDPRDVAEHPECTPQG